MKKCRKCDVELVVGGNWTAGNAKNGNYLCRACNNAKRKAWYQSNKEYAKRRDHSYYLDNRERVAKVGKRWRKSNLDKHRENAKAWAKANPGKRSAISARYRKANAEKISASRAEYRKANPGKITAHTANRRALIKKQTPSWYDHEMVTEIYEVASEFGYHVDHIVPLAKGGLHSHENLQLLTPAENLSKSDSDCWINKVSISRDLSARVLLISIKSEEDSSNERDSCCSWDYLSISSGSKPSRPSLSTCSWR